MLEKRLQVSNLSFYLKKQENKQSKSKLNLRQEDGWK